MKLFKNLISPFQKVLLTKRLCPGCTAPLEKGKRYQIDFAHDMIICSCKRMFLYEKETDTYRRATFKEAEEFSKNSK